MKINKIVVIIYFTALAGMLWYNLSHVLVNDGVYEYRAYLMNIEHGWMFRYTLVNSCLVTTWIPSLIQRITDCDVMILFRVWPTIFYALMPVFTYLIAKRYLSTKYAIVAVLVVLFNSHILFFPDMGRVGVAFGFTAGLLWALLEKRLIWSIVFAVLIVFTHYGTSMIMIGIVGASFVLPLFRKRILRQYVIVFSVLLVLTGVWHFGIAGYSGDVMVQTLLQTEQTGRILQQNPAIFDITTREPAVQAAIGLNIDSIPQIIEVIANWMVVGIVTLGLYCVVKRNTDGQFKIMAIAFWGLILFTVAIPWLSVYYGGMRVYFMANAVLAGCFPLGAEKIAKIIHVPPLLIISVVLIVYALSTSGIIYLPFGLEKTFPVAVNLP